MIFQIHHRTVATEVLGAHEFYSWTLEKADGTVVAEAPGHSNGIGKFASEAATRTHIAAAKKSMAGAGRCKVVSPPSSMDATVESIPEQRS